MLKRRAFFARIFTASQVNVEHEMIRLLVVSIDSITENILNHALDVIRSEDYDAIIAALNEITKKNQSRRRN